MRGLEGGGGGGAGVTVFTGAVSPLSFWFCCELVTDLLGCEGCETGTERDEDEEHDENEEEDVFVASSLGLVGEGVVVGVATADVALDSRLVGRSFKCFPLTISARLEMVCSELVGGGGGGGAELGVAVDPLARGGKWAGEWSMAFWGDCLCRDTTHTKFKIRTKFCMITMAT